MFNKIKRITCFVCSVIFILLCFPASAGAIGVANPMHDTYVEDDLAAMGYDLSDYPADPSADFVSIVSFYEYGYDFYEDQRYYGLYIYLYNPSGREILSTGNSVQLNFIDKLGKIHGYKKYKLEVMSVSDGSTSIGENVLYKMFVSDSRYIGEKIRSECRDYSVSGIELQYDDSVGAKPEDTLVEGIWSYTGHQVHFGAFDDSPSTLECTYDYNEVISTALKPASWFSNTSDLGEDYRYEVSSVYFSVPDYFVNKYGDPLNISSNTSGLVSVKGEYYKYVTDGLLLSSDKYKNNFEQLAGKSLYDFSGRLLYPGGGFFFDLDGEPVPDGLIVNYSLSYNMQLGEVNTDKLFTYGTYYFSSDDVQSHLCNVLVSDDIELPYSSTDSFLEAYNRLGRNNYNNAGGLCEKNQSIFSGLGHNEYFINVNGSSLNNAIKSFASTNKWGSLNWLHRLFSKDLYVDEEGYPDILPIVEIRDDDIDTSKYDLDKISSELFITTDDVSNLKNFYNDLSADNHIYLMRFEVNPYYCPEVCVTAGTENTSLAIYSDEWEYEMGYYFEKAVFHDFDIFELEYENKDHEKVSIAVVCDPIDLVGVITPGNNIIDSNPNNGNSNEAPGNDSSAWKLIVAIILFAIIVIGIILAINYFTKVWGINKLSDLLRPPNNNNRPSTVNNKNRSYSVTFNRVNSSKKRYYKKRKRTK